MNTILQSPSKDPARQYTASYIQNLVRRNSANRTRLKEIEKSVNRGNYAAAYNLLREITSGESLDRMPPLVVADIYKFLERIKNPNDINDLQLLEEDLIQYRQQSHVDGSAIRTLCLQVILNKYTYQPALNFNALADDVFLMDCLANDYYCNPQFEVMLTSMRRQLLMMFTKSSSIQEEFLPLYQVLAYQGYLTDFAFYEDPTEETLVNELKNLITQQLSQSEWSLEQVAPLLLILAMYGRIYDIPGIDSLQALNQDQVPDYLQSIFVLSYLEPLDVEHRKGQVQTLGAIQEQTSHVRNQYENYPFPRSNRMPYLNKRVSYNLRSRHLIDRKFNTSVLDNNPLEILVAGCGTGYHPLNIGKSVKNCHVTAVDISKTSLAFAERLKCAYEVDNVDFYQADILQLADIFGEQHKKFHLIECAGVLHHMQDLEKGLSNLVELLVPGGILHLGLYSKMARAPIQRIRQLNEKINLQSDMRSIREFRRQFLASKLDESCVRILKSRDFYNTFGCKDLLFNSQERCLSIPEIESLLAANGLDFLGFSSIDTKTAQLYQQMFPADKEQRRLENWHRFESAHPSTFWEMYRFHCQKPFDR